jgi:hypothetical protein
LLREFATPAGVWSYFLAKLHVQEEVELALKCFEVCFARRQYQHDFWWHIR